MAEEQEVPTEIESLCMSCYKNGITKLHCMNIPFYKQVILMSFYCDHCGNKNNNLQSGEPAQEFGTDILLKVVAPGDLNRTLVRSEYGSFEVPELELQIPPRSSGGDLTTVEGVLMATKNDLLLNQQQRRSDGLTEDADKIDNFISRLDDLLALKRPWTLKLHEPSGNCFVQNPNPSHADPQCITSHYYRPPEENQLLGFIDDGQNPGVSKDEDWKSYDDVKNEVLYFKSQCHQCGGHAETRMKPTDIPYFQTVIVMSTDCENCGFKSNEVQSGGAIQPQGCQIILKLRDVFDLARDVLKTDSCKVSIPELDIEVGAGIISGRFTTVEGLISWIKDHLGEQAPFFIGDSSSPEQRSTFKKLIASLEDILQLKLPCTLVLDDPTGNSYLQSLTAPLNDDRLDKEYYTRTSEQDEELGIKDMIVENYSTEGKMISIKEDNELDTN